jgi:beta-mannosidase
VFNRLSLCGKWKLRWSDSLRGGFEHHVSDSSDAKWLDASVPGEVHLDLMEAGLIDSPYIGINCLSARWVEESLWSYRKVFSVPKDALESDAWLYFEGLDYTAVIYLNGEEVGRHSNFFYPCRVNVTGKLREGDNTLVVQVESGMFAAAEKPIAGYPLTQDATNMLLRKRIWLRKPQCSFGWDWSPILLNVGIHKPVYLEWAKCVRVDEVVVLADVNEFLSEGYVNASVFVEGLEQEHLTGKIVMSILESNTQVATEVEISAGMQMFEVSCTISDPELWWPVGHGKQALYTVEVEVLVDETAVSKTRRKVGFRKVRINQDPHPEKGTYYIIEINGRKVFAKGANFVPGDIIFASLDRERYEILIDRALEANFNMLRVWGGGLYESDDFYELCDEKGILVWQEFIFACSRYPATDSEFLKNVKAEAVYNVRRLANHPSLIVWCGNNEQEWQNTYMVDGHMNPDYALYHRILPEILKQEDPTRYYQPSSPISPNHEFPNADHTGDQHPWGIGFDNLDFRGYRNMICRFSNEGGILGPTSLESMYACLPEGQRYINSFAWQVHENAIEGLFAKSSPERVVSEWIGKDSTSMSVEEYTYFGGLLQGEGLREFIDNFRRRKFDSAAAIFWTFNDCWPAVRSWTIVDYYLNRTPSFYPVKRAFAPISIVVTREEDKVNIYGVNDTPFKWEGQVQYGVFTLSGDYVMDEFDNVQISENASSCVASFAIDQWEKAGCDKAIAFAMLKKGGKVIARNRLFLPRFCEMKWPKAEVEMERDGEYIVFRSNVFAWGICLDLEGKKELPDNFFDVWPQVEYRLPWAKDAKLPEILKIGNL